MPSALTVGSSMGTNTNSSTDTSRKQPSTRKITLTNSRNCRLDSCRASTQFAMDCGTPSAVNAKLSMKEPARIMVITALPRVDSITTPQKVFQVSARYTTPARMSAWNAATAAASVGVNAPE